MRTRRVVDIAQRSIVIDDTSAPQQHPLRGLLAVLTAAMGAGPLLTYALSATGAVIIDDLGISAAQFGLLASLTFVTAAALSLTVGRRTDRFGTRGLLVVVFAGASLSFAVGAISRSYLWLLVAMFLSGAAQALSNPATNRIISERIPPTKRAAWVGVKQSGVQASQLVAGIGCPAMALVWGWRSALWVGAVVMAFLALVSLRTGTNSTMKATKPHPQVQPVKVRLPRTVWVFTIYALLSGAGLQATNVYLPLLAHREIGLSLTSAGLTAAVAGAVGVTARIGWGRALGRGIPTFALLLVLATGSAAGAIMLLLAAAQHSSALLWIGVFLHGAAALAANVVLMAGALRLVPAAAVGRASSTIAVGLYLGFACGPAGFGLLLATGHGSLFGWGSATVLYLLCIGLSCWGTRYGRLKAEPSPSIGDTLST